MTFVYCIQHMDGFYYVPTLAEARRDVKSMDEEASITRITVATGLRRRDLYCRLLNTEGFAEEQTDVK